MYPCTADFLSRQHYPDEAIKAENFLKRRLKEVGADQIGARAFVGPQQERITVNELLDALEAHYKLRGKDSPQFKAHLKHVREYFGHCRAIELTAESIDRYIAERQQAGAAAASINRGTQLLGQAYALAIERKRLVSGPKIRRLPEGDNVRQGFFSDAEFRAVLVNLPEYLKDFALFDRYNIVNERDQREALKRTQQYVARTARQESRRVVAMPAAAGI